MSAPRNNKKILDALRSTASVSEADKMASGLKLVRDAQVTAEGKRSPVQVGVGKTDSGNMPQVASPGGHVPPAALELVR